MKRMIKDCIELVVTINIETRTHVAASAVNHPKSIKQAKKLSDSKLLILNDIVSSVLSVIQSYNFAIIKKYQSNKSYTYYIWFQPQAEDGQKLTPVKIVFRISGDHDSKSIDDNIAEGTQVVVRSFLTGDEEYKDIFVLMSKIDKICKGLSEGDVSELFSV